MTHVCVCVCVSVSVWVWVICLWVDGCVYVFVFVFPCVCLCGGGMGFFTTAMTFFASWCLLSYFISQNVSCFWERPFMNDLFQIRIPNPHFQDAVRLLNHGFTVGNPPNHGFTEENCAVSRITEDFWITDSRNFLCQFTDSRKIHGRKMAYHGFTEPPFLPPPLKFFCMESIQKGQNK